MTAQRPDRIAVLDGLRLLAALMVVVFHYVGRTETDKIIWGAGPAEAFPLLHHAAQFGWLGVEMFFMISGFVICMSAWGRDLGSFIRSRAVRLFPAYWAAILITTTVVTLFPAVVQRRSFSNILVNMSMLQWPLKVIAVDGSYWTLWGEARFYLLFALLVWYGLTRRRAMWFGYGWLLASAITVYSNEKLLDMAFQPLYSPLFVAGIAFYLIHRFGSDIKLWGLVAASYLMAQHNIVARVATEARADIRGPLSANVGILILTAFYVILAVIALGWTSRIRWRWLTTAGLLTYPLYLIHQVIGWTIIHALHDKIPNWVNLLFTIGVMMLSAWLLHRLIERPLAGRLRKLLAPPRPAAVTPPEPPQPPQPQHRDAEPAGARAL